MRGSDFLDKMELIHPTYVEAADTIPEKKKSNWMKWGAAAACFLLAFLIGMYALRTKDTSSSVLLGGIAREYKNVNLTKKGGSIVWPWEYKTVFEQYTTLEFNGRNFYSRGRAIDSSLLGETIGNYDAVGFDSYAGEEYRMPAEVCRINGVSENQMVAVKLGGEFYVFKYNEYTPPANFGEVLDYYSLAQTVNFDRFTVCESYTNMGHYSLEDDRYIWDILNTCRDAAFIKDDSFSMNKRNYISFTVTSEALGVYKQVFYVTSDGYIKTNIFDWAYIFEIGEDAANRILSYATENGAESVMEPYTYTLAGTLVEITDGFLFVDDSILCSRQKDGMVFKIPTEDLRISRCIDFENISIGDIVVVDFTGNIDTAAGNVVEGAYSLSKGILSEDGVFVNE